MRMLILLAALFAATSSSAVSAAGLGQPYIPANDGVVLQQVPQRTDPRVRRFDVLRGRLAAAPHDQTKALALARAYVGYGRGTGDARYLGRAEAVIAPWLKQQPVPVPVLLMHATILQSRHYFDESRDLLKQILHREPDNRQAWLTLASVNIVQARFADARHACSHLLGASNPLLPAACLGALDGVTGRAEDAYRVLTMLQPQAQAASPGVRAWLQGIMADLAKHLGDDKSADRHFRKALQLEPGDNFTLADYADFLLDRHRPKAALELVQPYSSSDTSFLRQVMAEQALGLPQASADIQQMAQRFAALERRGSRTYRREEAMFVLYLQKQPQHALHLAQENWQVQRAPKDQRVYLAAALAAGKPQVAQPVLDLLAHSHLQDPAIQRLAQQVRAALASPQTSP